MTPSSQSNHLPSIRINTHHFLAWDVAGNTAFVFGMCSFGQCHRLLHRIAHKQFFARYHNAFAAIVAVDFWHMRLQPIRVAFGLRPECLRFGNLLRVSDFFHRDLEENARFQVRWAQAERNSDWLQAHVPEIYRNYRGQYIVVAGEELFVGDTVQEAVALAKAAHPEDEGRLTRYIPLKKMVRIYAN